MVQYRSQVHCSSVLSQMEQTMGPGMGASLKTVPDRRLRRQGRRTKPFAKELQAHSVLVEAALLFLQRGAWVNHHPQLMSATRLAYPNNTARRAGLGTM